MNRDQHQDRQTRYFRYLETRQRLDPFPADTGFYQSLIALWLAHCAALAYEPQNTIVRELQAAGFDKVTFFDSGHAQAFLAEHPGAGTPPFNVLSFRGTENDYKDILTNAAVIKRALIEGESAIRVHGGFLSALQSILGTHAPRDPGRDLDIDVTMMGPPGIRDALVARKRPGSRLYVTGHSLGGAMATLAAAVCAPLEQGNLKALYTIGSPRVGNFSFAKHLNGQRDYQRYRIVNAADIVPRVPMSMFFYKHAGDYLYLTRNGRLKQPGSFLCSLIDVGLLQGVFIAGSCIVLQRLLSIACERWLAWQIDVPYFNEIAAAVLTLSLFVMVFITLPKLIAMLPTRMLKWWKLSALSDHYTTAYREKLDSLARLPGNKPALDATEPSVATKTT